MVKLIENLGLVYAKTVKMLIRFLDWLTTPIVMLWIIVILIIVALFYLTLS